MDTKKLIYKIQFFTPWHASSGLSAGTTASNTVMKDKDDLPYIPGKTLKGLLRDAAENMKHLPVLMDQGFIDEVFGLGDDEVKRRNEAAQKKELTEYQKLLSYESDCHFSDATLSKDLAEGIIASKNVALLYENSTSTAIDTNGQAKDHSLRTIEVTIPLTLYGQIENFPNNSADETKIKYCFQWIKRMGLNRNRGLGRCQFSIHENTTEND